MPRDRVQTVLVAVVVQGLYVLAVIAMVSAVIGAFLYLRIIVAMYFDGNEYGGAEAELEGPAVRMPAGAAIALGLAVLGTLWLGILPDAATDVAGDAVAQLVAFGN